MEYECNKDWPIDYTSDSLDGSRRFWTLNVVDHYICEFLGIVIDHSLPACWLVQVLGDIIERAKQLVRIGTDNGLKFISKRFQL